MTKQRIEGAVEGDHYVIRGPDGGIMKKIPLEQAMGDHKLASAIQRNGWGAVPNG